MTVSLSAKTSRRTFGRAARAALVIAALAVGACASGRALSRAERAAQMGDWDTAVAYYTRAAQAEPGRAEYKVALERALENAALAHLEKGRLFEAKGQLDEALREYRRASEYDPLNGEIAAKVRGVTRAITERIEAARPKPRIEQLREQARQTSPEPTLNPASRQPLDIVFSNTSVRAILDFIGKSTGINITYDRDTGRQVETGQYSVELHGVTLEQALNQIITANVLFYKVLDPHTILVVTDTAAKRQQYEEQVIQTFYISHVEASDLMTVLTQVMTIPNLASRPSMQVNKTANTITIRSTAPVAKIIEQVIAANDKPRAELVLDVEVLEVNRTRAKQYGLDLSDYSVNLVFSPEAAPGTGTTGTSLFNLNSLNGLHKGDFYMSVPPAIIRLLESDTDTKLVAKPQLRGSEGEKLSLNLGSEIPVPLTTFGAYAGGGINTIPISTFQLRNVGLNFEITPRVTFDGDIILTLSLENSTYLGTISMAGQDLPSFGTRRVTTRLRLRDGETNLLAGLLQTTDSRTVTGFPGLLRLPILRQIFASNKTQVVQTDIVMLLTPHVIRSHELTERDVSPIYIGTPSNLGLSGPPPLIAAPPAAAGGEQPPAAQQPPGAPTGAPPTAQAPVVPAKVPPTPGTVSPPAAQQPPGAPTGAQPPAAAATPPATPAQPTAQPPAAGGALVTVSVPTSDLRAGSGTYTVPITINGATGISTLSITVRYNPAVLQVRSVQDGTFMRQGGLNPGFAQQVDAAGGRLDITFTRAGDITGASGGGLLGAILVDAVAAGSTTLSISGVAAGPTGTPVSLQFAPATITVR